MSSSLRNVKLWVSAWVPVLIGIAVIIAESTETFGANHTAGPLRWFLTLIYGPISNSAFDKIHFLIRKSGHFLGYGLIGLAWLRAWRMTYPRLPFASDAILALLGVGLMASLDEWHQSFLPNRTSSPTDVLIDCCGATMLILITYLWLRFLRPDRLESVA